MSNSSGPLHDCYADLDFTDAKPVGDIPALARLQAEAGGKTRISMRLDGLATFKTRAEMTGGPHLCRRRGKRPPAQ